MRRRDEGTSVARRDSGSASRSVTTALRSRQRVVSRGLNVEDKRYVNTSDTLKPPCTRRGESELGFDGAPHDAQPSGALPAAD